MTDWAYVNGQRVPMELKLLLSVQGVPNVIKLLDFFERRDSFIYVLERPSKSKVCRILEGFCQDLDFCLCVLVIKFYAFYKVI